MSDIALVEAGDGSMPAFDFALEGGDLKLDLTLRTPIIVSLFCDRQAEPDDELPDSTDTDRRGWWGDAPVTAGDARELSGSRLWLIERAKAITKTATRAKQYIGEALQWMTDDGVAKVVTVEAAWKTPEFLAIGVMLSQANGAGKADVRYDLIWKATV